MSHDEVVLKAGSVLRSEDSCCLRSERLELCLRYPGFAPLFMVMVIGYIVGLYRFLIYLPAAIIDVQIYRSIKWLTTTAD